jgi:GNAT superfamily N-acetyltransferase
MTKSHSLELTFQLLTPDRFSDFERLFGISGACGGCWCMFWKLRGKAFHESTGDVARQMQRSIVEAGTVTGLLAYLGDEPIGWIAVEPRKAYPKLAHSRTLKAVDEREVWSVPCFYVDKNYRRQGVTIQLLRAAIEYVQSMGGDIVEGYPVDTHEFMPAPFIFTGTSSAFQQAGFVEVARRSGTRPIVRYEIGG